MKIYVYAILVFFAQSSAFALTLDRLHCGGYISFTGLPEGTSYFQDGKAVAANAVDLGRMNCKVVNYVPDNEKKPSLIHYIMYRLSTTAGRASGDFSLREENKKPIEIECESDSGHRVMTTEDIERTFGKIVTLNFNFAPGKAARNFLNLSNEKNLQLTNLNAISVKPNYVYGIKFLNGKSDWLTSQNYLSPYTDGINPAMSIGDFWNSGANIPIQKRAVNEIYTFMGRYIDQEGKCDTALTTSLFTPGVELQVVAASGEINNGNDLSEPTLNELKKSLSGLFLVETH